jgi:hypothetical protein
VLLNTTYLQPSFVEATTASFNSRKVHAATGEEEADDVDSSSLLQQIDLLRY